MSSKEGQPRRFAKVRKWLSNGLDVFLSATIATSGMGVPTQGQKLDNFPPEAILASHIIEKNNLSPEYIAESEVKNWQPKKPYFLWIAYPWTKNMAVDGTWSGSYWADNGNKPPHTWINSVMPMFKEDSTNPEDNLYSSNDPEYWKWVMELSKAAHIPIIMFSDWGIKPDGTDSKTHATIKKIAQFMNSDQNPFPLGRYSALFEPEGSGNPTIEQIVKWVEDYKSFSQDNPSAWRDPDDGKLIIGAYGVDEEDWEMFDRYKRAEEITGVHFLLRPFAFSELKSLDKGRGVFDNGESDPYGCLLYAPANRIIILEKNDMSCQAVSPGFDKGTEKEPRLERDPNEFRKVVQQIVDNPLDVNAIETLDEWGEKTAVAPALEVYFTKYGMIIDWKKSWGYTYINILAQTLPELPIVVPDGKIALYENEPKIVYTGNLTSKNKQTAVVWADNQLSKIILPAVGRIYPKEDN